MSMKFFSNLQDFLNLYDTTATGFVTPPPQQQQQPSTSNQHRHKSSNDSKKSNGGSNENRSPPGTPKHCPTKPSCSENGISSDQELVPTSPLSPDNEKNAKEKRTKKSVSFPVDDSRLVAGSMEPRKPIFHLKKPGEKVLVEPQDILRDYANTCRKMKVQPSSKVETQISFFHHLAHVRQETLSLKGEKITHAHMECLEEIFRRVQFDLLDFEYSFLDDESAVALAEMLEFYDSGLKLNLSFNQRIGIRGWQALFRLLKNSPCLDHLNLRYTSINDRSVPLLARALRCEPNLTVLHLENCSLSSKSMLLLVCALKSNSVLKELYLGENNLGPNDCAHLYQLITGNSSIQLLDLRNNNIQDAGLQHICDALSDPDSWQNGSLTTLVLWNNRLSPNGMDSIRVALRVNSRLETINLGCNNMGSVGIEFLKDSLARNRTLLRLGLQATKLNCQAAIALAECIADNPTLVRVDLRDNPEIKSAGLLALHLAMKINTGITALNLDKSSCYTNNKVKDYSEQFKQYFDEILEFCERNRLAAIEKKSKVNVKLNDSIEEKVVKQDEQTSIDSGIEEKEQIQPSEEPSTTKPPESLPVAILPVQPVAVPLVTIKTELLHNVHVKHKLSHTGRSLSLTCTEPVADFLARLAAMPREEGPKRQEHKIIYESSDEEETEQSKDGKNNENKPNQLLASSLPSSLLHSPPQASRFLVSQVNNLANFGSAQRSSSLPSLEDTPSPTGRKSRFSVSPVSISTRFAVTPAPGPASAPLPTTRPSTLPTEKRPTSPTKKPKPRGLRLRLPSSPEPETDEDRETAVKSVVNDLVNFCVYELGDYAYTPSVPKSKRKISDDFEQRTPRKVEPVNVDTFFPEKDENNEETLERPETESEIETAVQATVRDLVKGCILTERDTLRRSLRKKRAKLSSVFDETK